jgi:hypothetical protein
MKTSSKSRALTAARVSIIRGAIGQEIKVKHEQRALAISKGDTATGTYCVGAIDALALALALIKE